MPTAIITGATGMLGRQIMFELGKTPEQWTKVHALSHSKSDENPKNAVHGHIDLLAGVDGIAKNLKEQDISGEYLFFTAYLAKDSDKELWDVNSKMLDDFLKALDKTGASKKLKRIILVTGAKQYGVHLGRPKNPMLESDPWLTGPEWPPNFYYSQQDIVREFCEKHENMDWVVTYPNDIVGYVKGNFMNLSTALGLYVAITKELGEELVWPGSERFYTAITSFTSSKMHAQFVAWAALEPKAGNEAFNITNGDVVSWQDFWPRIARYFGTTVKPDQFLQPPPDENNFDMAAERPPVVIFAKEAGLQGKTERSRVEARVNLMNWIKRDDVKQAWARLAEREGLEKDAFDKATWDFLTFIVGRNFDIVIDMNKAREFGWTGYKNTWEAFEETFAELEAGKVLPKRS